MIANNFSFDSMEYASRFNFNRSLTPDIENFWADYVLGSALASVRTENREPRILDIGCGTGRFAVLFAKKGCIVAGIDTSLHMIRQAISHAEENGVSNVAFVQGSARDYPQIDHFDVVFLSEVLHLTDNIEELFHHCFSLLRVGGSVVVRTSTKDQAAKRHFLRYFPSALKMESARHHDLPTLIGSLREAGFEGVYSTSIDEGYVVDKSAYVAAVTERFHSILHRISESEFTEGLEGIRRSNSTSIFVDFPVSLLKGIKQMEEPKL